MGGLLARSQSELRKVLVVDDDPDWREFVITALQDLGYEALEAADGPSALECLSREMCSIVLLDLNMPGMGGEEVAQRMNKSGQTRVVFVTSATPKDAGSALAAGPHYYLPKDASLNQLSLLLQSLDS
jgi:CheY-like chemotaxis protein